MLLVGVYFELAGMEMGDSGYTAMMHFDVMVARLICGYLMHMISEPEVRQAISMLKYVVNHIKSRG